MFNAQSSSKMMGGETAYQLTKEQNDKISKELSKERSRLFGFIRKRVPSDEDAQDVLQDVFFQFVQMYRNLESIERTTSWLYRVARNRITDLYRKRKDDLLEDKVQDNGGLVLDDLLPDSHGLNHEDEYTRELIWEVLEEGLNELPVGQRDAFVLNELEGYSFKEISEETGVSVNTLISRKRYAVLSLREKLDELFKELKQI